MTAPIRVLLFDHTARMGGGEVALFNLVTALSRDVVEPIVLVSMDGPLVTKLRGICEVHVLPLAEDLRSVKKDSLGISAALQLKSVFGLIRYCLQLRRFIKTNRIELVHTNSLKADLIGGVSGRLAGVPVLWHIRDRIENDYLPASVVTAFRLLCRFLPSYVVANSQATLETLSLPGPSKAAVGQAQLQIGRSGVVHDGLPLSSELFDEPEPNAPRIGLIGRIAFWKGQHIFLDAAKMVNARFPDARFEIIGAPLFGEEGYETELRQQCSRLGLEGVVHFAGFTSEVTKAIASLSIVVHASVTGEPFGQVIIEGMAAKKPVVATRGGGVPEIVVHGQTGLLVPMSDAPAMAEAICTMLDDPATARSMGEKGFARVVEKFTIQRTARAVEQIYCRMIKRPSHLSRELVSSSAPKN